MIDIEKEIAKNYPKLKKNKIVKKAIGKFANSVIHQDRINEFLAQNAHLDRFGFIQSVMEYFDFDFSYKDKELENIPSHGRVVIIANHPLGGLDALALLDLVAKVRKDIKIVANDFLRGFEPLRPLLLEINNFQSRQSKASITQIYDALNSDEAVIFFPAGEVSRLGPSGVKDGRWNKGFLNFAKRTASPILPVHINAKNSKTFYSVSSLNKNLATLLLADEMFKQKNKTIKIGIGKIIPAKYTLPKGVQTDKVVKMYRKQIYAISKGNSFFQTQSAIAHPGDIRDIKKELDASQHLGSTRDGKAIYLYQPDPQSNELLKELGRLREISFRKVGEGANKRRDIDRFDNLYKHIVLFDPKELEVVGAYRIAECAQVIDQEGITGLYTATLFEPSSEFIDTYTKDAIELGRSFVQPKYWGTRALDYLWQGIGAYLKANPDIRYMFGPVTLSAGYPKVAKDLILGFYDGYFGSPEELVRARLPYRFASLNEMEFDEKFDFSDYKKDFKTLKKLLQSLEVSVPMLYKQYSDLCEEGGIRFCAYNIDPDFSECIDSFILVDTAKIKPAQRKRYIG